MANAKTIAACAKKYVGQKRMAGCGMEMEMVAYRGAKDIDVRFADGALLLHKDAGAFRKGQIGNPNIRPVQQTAMRERVGEKRTATCGMQMEVITYRSAQDIDVRFEDGTVVKHKPWNSFLSGKIANPSVYSPKKDRTGQTMVATCGMEMTVIAYRGCHDIDVQFKDGTIVTHRSMKEFRKGWIANPNVPTGTIKDIPDPQVGDTFTNVQGIQYEIVECMKDGKYGDPYRIRYEDGTEKIIRNKSCLYNDKNIHPHLPAMSHTSSVKASKPVRIGGMNVTGTAYIYKTEYNFFCRCPVCGHEDILTAEEARKYQCNCKKKEETWEEKE